MTAWTATEEDTLRILWDEHGGGFRKIAKIMGRTRGSIDGKSRILGLQFHGGRSRTLSADDPAARNATTVFPKRIVSPDRNVLKSGDNQRKLGRIVQKGAWKGFPIFSLTLIERETCPSSCKQWLSCYMNNLGHAKRYEHGPALERELSIELAFLQRHHPRGFVVRLHIGGDFMSVAYVEFWREALALYPAMRCFGYTARQADDPIGAAINKLRDECWERFAIRTSGAGSGPRTAVFDPGSGEKPHGIVCVAQHNPAGKARACSSCALCWSPTLRETPILFEQH